MSLFEAIYKELIAIGEKPDSIVGCTPSEIEEIKHIQGVMHLPHMYRDFLLTMGHGAGTLFVGTGIFYEAMKYFNFKDEAQNFLGEMDVKFELPEKAFVFLWHQAYTFFYFNTQSNEIDPVIYRYQEGYKEPVNAGFLSDLFLDEVKLHKKIIGYKKD